MVIADFVQWELNRRFLRNESVCGKAKDEEENEKERRTMTDKVRTIKVKRKHRRRNEMQTGKVV